MRNGTCKGCGASIVWIGTLSGKSMPCDTMPVYYKVKASGRDKVVTPNGETISCDIVSDPNIADGVGYIPHWGTCPAADKFRKR